jgi:hypothetical protein
MIGSLQTGLPERRHHAGKPLLSQSDLYLASGAPPAGATMPMIEVNQTGPKRTSNTEADPKRQPAAVLEYPRGSGTIGLLWSSLFGRGDRRLVLSLVLREVSGESAMKCWEAGLGIAGAATALRLAASPLALAASTGAPGSIVATATPSVTTAAPSVTTAAPSVTTAAPGTLAGRLGGVTGGGISFVSPLPRVTTALPPMTATIPSTVAPLPALTTAPVVRSPVGTTKSPSPPTRATMGLLATFPGTTGLLATPPGAARLAAPGSTASLR